MVVEIFVPNFCQKRWQQFLASYGQILCLETMQIHYLAWSEEKNY